MTMRLTRLLVGTALFTLIASAVIAQDRFEGLPDDSIALSGGIGLGYISASEFVFDGGFKNSQLDYRSTAITIYDAKLSIALPKGFTLRFGGNIGTDGEGELTDYDWVAPFYTNTGKDGWSDRSISKDTDLSHYWNAWVELGHNILATTDGFKLEGLAGFKYTDVEWNSYGGNYVYSTDDLRDTIGSFDAGEKVLSYRQKVPVAYVGLNAIQTTGDLTINGGLNVGVSFGIRDTDNHWLRDAIFHEDMDAAPVVMANVGVAYALTPRASLFLSSSFERVFRARGDSRMVDQSTGERSDTKDVAGALFQSVAIKLGFNAEF